MHLLTFLELSHDMYMILVSICLAHVPCCITLYVPLCIMYLHMFINYVVLHTCDYGYVLIHVYILYMLVLTFMSVCHSMMCIVHSIP